MYNFRERKIEAISALFAANLYISGLIIGLLNSMTKFIVFLIICMICSKPLFTYLVKKIAIKNKNKELTNKIVDCLFWIMFVLFVLLSSILIFKMKNRAK
ncbi:MAG: hypothetical protein IKQ13_15170 [Treponema sp.]|nr:hypothetical protein [Treponema sp.]